MCAGFNGDRLSVYHDRMNQRIEGAMSGGIDRAVIVRRGILRRSCGTAVRAFLAQQSSSYPVFRIVDRQVGTRKVPIVLQESNYVAAR